MFSCKTKQFSSIISLLLVTFVLLSSWGCAGMKNSGEDPAETASTPENVPYYPTELKDLQVPSELKFNRENSMYINTASFAGGILSFTGRVEINSLTDFFISTMAKHSWKLSGSVRYKNVMLAFVKPNKTCLIVIKDSYGISTQVNVYVSQDISETSSSLLPSEEVFR